MQTKLAAKQASLGKCFSGGINKKKLGSRGERDPLLWGQWDGGKTVFELVLEGREDLDSFLWEMKNGQCCISSFLDFYS